MSRPKGSKNKIKPAELPEFSYTTEQRIALVANLIVERIAADQRKGRLLMLLSKEHHVT
jgi:hypothetical protein